MSPVDNKAVIRRYIEEVLNDGRLEVIDEVFAPDFVNHDPLPGSTPDREGFKQGVILLRAAFPDLHYVEEDMLAEDDSVAPRITFYGTHAGEYMGIAPTGRKVACAGIGMFRLQDGLIRERWTHLDMLGLLQQLGALGIAERPSDHGDPGSRRLDKEEDA